MLYCCFHRLGLLFFIVFSIYYPHCSELCITSHFCFPNMDISVCPWHMFYTSVISLQQICENGFICICVRNKLVLDESCIQMYNVKWLYLHLGQIELFMMYILTVLVVLQDALIRLVHLFHSSISNLAFLIAYTIARSNVNHSVLITCCFVYSHYWNLTLTNSLTQT